VLDSVAPRTDSPETEPPVHFEPEHGPISSHMEPFRYDRLEAISKGLGENDRVHEQRLGGEGALSDHRTGGSGRCARRSATRLAERSSYSAICPCQWLCKSAHRVSA